MSFRLAIYGWIRLAFISLPWYKYSLLSFCSVLVLSGCSLLGVSHSTHEPGKPSGYPGSVGEIAWTWKPPRGAGRAALHEMGEGVLVLLDTGVFALSGKTGEEV